VAAGQLSLRNVVYLILVRWPKAIAYTGWLATGVSEELQKIYCFQLSREFEGNNSFEMLFVFDLFN